MLCAHVRQKHAAVPGVRATLAVSICIARHIEKVHSMRPAKTWRCVSLGHTVTHSCGERLPRAQDQSRPTACASKNACLQQQ